MARPAVFLDRDGTINEQMGYINHLSRFRLLSGVADAIGLLNEKGFLAIVVSNQSGVGRGYFPVDLVFEVHKTMKDLLKQHDAYLDGVYFCPHYPRSPIPEYRKDCDCRKPGPGMIHMACRDFDIDLAHSYVVGDRYSDMKLAHGLGLKSIMVRTGYGRGELEFVTPDNQGRPDFIADHLLGAVHWIVSDYSTS